MQLAESSGEEGPPFLHDVVSAVGAIAEDMDQKGAFEGCLMTPEAVAEVVKVMCVVGKTATTDTVQFAQHARHGQVGADDVALLARRRPDLQELITRAAGPPTKPTKKGSKKKEKGG